MEKVVSLWLFPRLAKSLELMLPQRRSQHLSNLRHAPVPPDSRLTVLAVNSLPHARTISSSSLTRIEVMSPPLPMHLQTQATSTSTPCTTCSFSPMPPEPSPSFTATHQLNIPDSRK